MGQLGCMQGYCVRCCAGLPDQAHVEGWAKEWQLSAEEERTLYLAAADTLRASKKKKAGPADAYRLTLKALAMYQARPRLLAGCRNAVNKHCNVVSAHHMPSPWTWSRPKAGPEYVRLAQVCLSARDTSRDLGNAVKLGPQEEDVHEQRLSRICVKWLPDLVQGAHAAELAVAKDVAAGAAADFLRMPEQFHFDLLEAEPVAQLRTDPEHGPLYRLLTVLLTSADVKARPLPDCIHAAFFPACFAQAYAGLHQRSMRYCCAGVLWPWG